MQRQDKTRQGLAEKVIKQTDKLEMVRAANNTTLSYERERYYLYKLARCFSKMLLACDKTSNICTELLSSFGALVDQVDRARAEIVAVIERDSQQTRATVESEGQIIAAIEREGQQTRAAVERNSRIVERNSRMLQQIYSMLTQSSLTAVGAVDNAIEDTVAATTVLAKAAGSKINRTVQETSAAVFQNKMPAPRAPPPALDAAEAAEEYVRRIRRCPSYALVVRAGAATGAGTGTFPPSEVAPGTVRTGSTP